MLAAVQPHDLPSGAAALLKRFIDRFIVIQ